MTDLPKEMSSVQEKLEARLGISGIETQHLLAALTHKSYCNEHREQPYKDNERLEFLGDAVVNLAIGQRLFERFPLASEGELSKLRAVMVNEEGLAAIARHYRLGELLILGKGEEGTHGRAKSSLLADALEAVLGAVYLSLGMAPTLQLIDRLFAEPLQHALSGNVPQDYKSILQEDAQSRLKTAPKYRVVSETGPDHEKTFEVEVSIGATTFARSTGRSKKEAEQHAAKETLAMIKAM